MTLINIILSSVQSSLSPLVQADKPEVFWMNCGMFGTSAQIHHCLVYLVTAFIFLVHKSSSAMGGKA